MELSTYILKYDYVFCFIFTAEPQSTQRIIFLLLSAERAESNKEFIPTGIII